ncbi:hypothetical protein HDU98_004744 [Podochytrium sp. JEL0797]|nr:hypothetical protein HDU98_004744 [Podochytrium sp. JEL0797]
MGQPENHALRATLTPTTRRQPAALLGLLALVLCLATLWTHHALPSFSALGPRQPTTGGFEFASGFTLVAVGCEGSAAGDARIIVDQGTTDQAHVVFSIESDVAKAQDETQITAILSEDGESLSVRIWFPDYPKAKRLHADVRITLPHAIDQFVMLGNVASLIWQSTNVISNFNVILNIGSVRIYTPLDTTAIKMYTAVGSITAINSIRSMSLDLEADIGSIQIYDGIVNGYVNLRTDTGGITGVFHSYSVLNANVETGTIDVTLSPGVEDSETVLQSNTGSVDADVFGFVGNYVAKTKTGSVRISGNTHRTSANTGWVGSKDGLGTLDAQTKSGAVDLSFL